MELITNIGVIVSVISSHRNRDLVDQSFSKLEARLRRVAFPAGKIFFASEIPSDEHNQLTGGVWTGRILTRSQPKMPTRLQFQIISLSEWIAVEVKALRKAFGIDLKTLPPASQRKYVDSSRNQTKKVAEGKVLKLI